MKPEIKRRIEQIKAGQIPAGYKRTKAGIVPAEWEEKRIGDVLTQRKTLMCVSEDAPLLSFTIEEGVIDPENKKSNKRDFLIKDMSTKKFALTEVGDIIYNPANLKFGAIHRNDLKRGVVSPIYGIFYGKQNSEFMGYLLHNQRFIDYAKIYTEGTVEKLKTLKADTFLKLKITLPPIEEQEKIVEILSTQDRVIELQQKKIAELQKLKKVFLKKMFPQKGKKVPEWHFPQFTDDWEQREFGNIANRMSETSLSSDELPYIEYEDVISNQGVLNKDVSTKEGVKTGIVFSEEDVLYGKLRPYLHNWLNPDFKGVAVGDWWVLKPINADKNFLYRLIQSENFDNIANQSTGTKMPRADWKLVSATEFCVPKSLEEQAEIGRYFTNLDNLITLHQRKLDEMKKYKKSLMQLLLMGIVRVNK